MVGVCDPAADLPTISNKHTRSTTAHRAADPHGAETDRGFSRVLKLLIREAVGHKVLDDQLHTANLSDRQLVCNAAKDTLPATRVRPTLAVRHEHTRSVWVRRGLRLKHARRGAEERKHGTCRQPPASETALASSSPAPPTHTSSSLV
eukprot:3696550-Rhodomonas_salina.3